MGISLLRGRRRRTAPGVGAAAGGEGKKVGMRIMDVLKEPEEGDPCSCDDGGVGRGVGKASFPMWVCAKWVVGMQKKVGFVGRDGGKVGGCWVFMGGRGCRMIEGGKEVVVDEVGGCNSSCCADPLEERMTDDAVVDEEELLVVEEEGGDGGCVLEGGGDRGLDGGEVVRIQEQQSTSGKKPDEISFNMGLGIGLIFLLARSTGDLNKMAEMRREVEAMLKEVKDAMQTKGLIYESVESKNRLTFTGSDSCGDEDLTEKSLLLNRVPSFHLTESPAEQDEDSRGFTECTQDLVKLEEELESEFELMQIDCDEYPNRKAELTDENDDISESLNGSSEADLYKVKENVEQDMDDSCEYGICPRVLERRLYELLHAKNQERIAELESALQRAEQKLHEKEMEIRWWRDTAQICSHQKNEVFR